MREKLVTVASYSTPLDAHMAKSRLDSAGIDSLIFDEHTIAMNWLYSNLIGGVKIKVPEEDLEDARSVLGLDGVEVEAEDSWGTCPQCDSNDVEFIADKRGAFLSWVLMGIPFFPVIKRLKCRGCGHIWRYKE
jgi:hypothetical protein